MFEPRPQLFGAAVAVHEHRAIRRQAPDARDGEIVVALLIEENQATLKRIYRRGMNIELQPANSQLQPLTIPASQVRVQGIFRGLLRPSN